MGKKANKASRKYAASGQLKKEIQARRKHQQIKRTADRRKNSKPGGKAGSGKAENPSEYRKGAKLRDEDQGPDVVDSDAEVEDAEMSEDEEVGGFKGMSVDDFMNGGFLNGDMESGDSQEDENEGSEDSEDDNASFASIDDLEGDEAVSHKLELEKLKEQDPEFYKYLQENDKELLNFDVVDEDEDEEEGVNMDEDEDEDSEKAPTLTTEILRRWQKAILEHRSLRALRRLLIAFRAAAHMNEEDEVLAWSIDDPKVYEKLVVTSLRYMPIVLDHHVPYKKLPDDKFKPPTQTPKLKTMQKLILSYVHNVLHLIDQLTASETLVLAVTETSKLIPYITSSKKTVKSYLKTCLKLWSSAEDEVRIAAFLAMRRLASSPDEAIKDLTLKSTYLTLLRNAKSTTAHTLPSINLMKNSASELFCQDHATSYQHAFGYIRQLAIHLRNSMKVKSKDAYKQVYNWQYVHCIDFWSIVLANACNSEAELARGKESELRALIYPLTQVSLGAIKLISSSRSFPLHLNIIRSLVHLSRHTKTYIPLTPYLLPIISSLLAPTSRPKASTLKPLDIETHLRAPAQYVRTRVYASAVLDEAVFLATEWIAIPHIQASIAFPEIVVPVVTTLRRAIKKANSSGKGGMGKETGNVKGFVERLEETAKLITEKKKGVTFSPQSIDLVRKWEIQMALEAEESPLGKYSKSQRKVREKRRKLLEKARTGEEEYLDE